MQKIFRKNNMSLFLGKIAAVQETDDAKIVTLLDADGNQCDFYFRKSPYKLADRFEAANLGTGCFISVLAVANKAESEATVVDFKFRGRWVFKGEKGRTATVLMGTACKPKMVNENMFSLSLPVDNYVDGHKETTWVDVVFFNGERDGESWNYASLAAKALENYDNSNRPFVIINGGPIVEREFNGRIYQSMTGKRLLVRS